MLSQILVEIQNIVSQNKKSLVVFDLDSTLFNVSPRSERILKDFAALPETQSLFPQESQILQTIQTEHTDWGIQDALVRANLANNKAFADSAQNFWQQHFFSNHYLQFDALYDGALEYVQELDRIGAEISYLTGRDVARMGPGTIQILKDWNFPLHPTAKLELKPHRSMNDAEFKTDYFIKACQEDYAKIFFFENEPVNLIHLSERCPQVEMIFFDSTHSRKSDPPEGLTRIKDFLILKKET